MLDMGLALNFSARMPPQNIQIYHSLFERSLSRKNMMKYNDYSSFIVRHFCGALNI
jgi:hypothetical protein